MEDKENLVTKLKRDIREWKLCAWLGTIAVPSGICTSGLDYSHENYGSGTLWAGMTCMSLLLTLKAYNKIKTKKAELTNLEQGSFEAAVDAYKK